MAGLQIVQPQNLYNTLARLVEVAGLKEPALFFTDPALLRRRLSRLPVTRGTVDHGAGQGG